MEGTLRSIGAVARESGLSISALRFYDGAGVLRPARVDPDSGYRWYAAEQVGQARLIASVRRVGLPVADILEILAGWHEPGAAHAVLERHLGRLEDGLADARRELSAARALLEDRERYMSDTRITVDAADLRAALRSVRYAAATPAEHPALHGVLFDYDGDELTLVATDRYRLAAAAVPVAGPGGPSVQVVAPLAFVDGLAVAECGPTRIILGDSLTIGTATSERIDADFPDWRRLRPSAAARFVPAAARGLRERVAAGRTRTVRRDQDGVEYEVSTLWADDEGVHVGDEPGLGVGVNREFLLEAIDAGGAGQLVLGLDGPISPLVIRAVDQPGRFSLLMPTRAS